MSGTMDSAAKQSPTTDSRESSLHLLRDCFALGKPSSPRPPAKVRLEEALGPELTQQLLESLEDEHRQ